MMPDVQTRQQFWGEYEPKEAEVSNTGLMPANANAKRTPDRDSKTVIPKIGSVNSRVDVSGQDSPVVEQRKIATHYALPSHQRYPLDSYADVEQAVDYFQKWGGQFVPVHRREYCANLVKRASVLGVPTDDTIEKYGSTTYAPAVEVKVALDGRRPLIQHSPNNTDLAFLLDKLAEKMPVTPPEDFAVALHEFDKIAGIDWMYDKDIIDPYYSTFGKIAQDEGSFIMGNDITDSGQLKELAKTPCQGIEEIFGSEMCQEFKKDPVGIFKSLPVDQKKLISRMANEAKIV